MYDYREAERAWGQLPKAGIPGIDTRWIAPLVDRALDGWIADMAHGAYQINEDCGWLDVISDAPPMLDDDGAFDPRWTEAIHFAAELLAEAGNAAGPDGRVDRWLGWLLWELAEPHEWIRDRLER